MSEMETAKGIYRPFKPELSLEDACKEACIKEKIDIGDDATFRDQLMEWYYEEYLVLNGKLYYQAEVTTFDSYGFSEVNELPNGDIEFFCHWYNGGAGLGEVVESGLDD